MIGMITLFKVSDWMNELSVLLQFLSVSNLMKKEKKVNTTIMAICMDDVIIYYFW